MTEDIREIRGPILEAAATSWWPYAIAALVGIAIVVAIAALVRARRRAVPADQRALRELEQARQLIERGEGHQMSVHVSSTVRGYVEEVFQIHAPRRTTDELLEELLRVMSPVAPYRAELGSFLELCDLAKYARWSLSRAEMTKLVDAAERFVRATATAKTGAS